MSKSKASQIARQEMKSGSNCCQSILVAASQVWGIPLEDDVLAAAALFGGGMGSGCTCGALAGMVMASGIMNRYHHHPAGSNLSRQLHDKFREEFGAVCCRVIKKKRSAIQQIGNRACVDLTGKAASLLIAEWEGVLDAHSPESGPGINHNTNLK